MSLHGSLNTVSLAGVLQLLCNECKTGILSVTNGKEEYQIFYLDGAITYAIQSKKHARLGALLVNDGVITEADLQACLEEAKQKKLAIGRVLVQNALISKQILEKYIYKQVEEVMVDLFKWESGEFSYNDARLSLSWLIEVKLNTLQLVMDATRRYDEYRRGKDHALA